MAKRTTALARYRPPPVVVVSSPRGGLRRRGRSSVRRVARGGRRRHHKGGGAGVTSTTSIVTLGIGGAGVGYLAAKGHLNFLPAVGGSRMVTLGLAGIAMTKFARNKYLKAAGLAALAAAAFDIGRAQAGGGMSTTTAGDDDVEGDEGSGQGF